MHTSGSEAHPRNERWEAHTLGMSSLEAHTIGLEAFILGTSGLEAHTIGSSGSEAYPLGMTSLGTPTDMTGGKCPSVADPDARDSRRMPWREVLRSTSHVRPSFPPSTRRLHAPSPRRREPRNDSQSQV